MGRAAFDATRIAAPLTDVRRSKIAARRLALNLKLKDLERRA